MKILLPPTTDINTIFTDLSWKKVQVMKNVLSSL
jgi:hypothetical protein